MVNYKDHPSDKNYSVFNFNLPEEADMFASELDKADIWYEKDTEPLNDNLLYLFVVRQLDFEKAQKINYRVTAAFKKPLIRNAFLRYGLLALFFAILGLAIVGYVKNSKIYKPETFEPADK